LDYAAHRRQAGSYHRVSWLAKLLRSKVFVVTLIVLPGLWPAWPILRHDPSVLADPLKYVLHHLGFVACLLLAAVLSFTPLRVLFPKWGVALALNRHRRLVGVSAFVYGALHFTTHLVYEGGFHILASDITKPFLVTGMITLSILLVLAATSFNAALRWLGGRRWKNLHRLAYVAAALAAYHQAAARKIFPQQVLWIFVPLAVLELLRIVRQRQGARAPAKPAAAAS
jgi:sulfoxide reductase heme-binding subunit YedZ